MKKAAALVAVAGALLGVWFFWQLKKPRPVPVPVEKSEFVKKERTEREAPEIAQTEQKELATSERTRTKHRELPLGFYPQKKIQFASSHLWMLEGLTATTKKRSEKEIARLNQYYIYKTPSNEMENIVYDDEKRQYGVLTLELTVVVQEGVLSGLAQKYGLEVLKEGDLGSESILRSENSLFFTRELPDFVREQGLVSFRPYVSYGLARFR